MSPEQVKQLRGGLTQDAFAKLLRVSRQSVHRWEVPPNHTDSSRPKGKNLRKLLEYQQKAMTLAGQAKVKKSSGKGSSQPPVFKMPGPFSGVLPANESELLNSLLSQFLNGKWTTPIKDMEQLFSQEIVSSLGAKLVARALLGLRFLYQNHDPVQAQAVCGPLVQALQNNPLAPISKQVVHLALAHLHAWPSRPNFSPSRAFYHADKVLDEALPMPTPLNDLAHIAKLQAAHLKGKRQLFLLFEHNSQISVVPGQPPLVTALKLESLALKAQFFGNLGQAFFIFQDLARHGVEHDLEFAWQRGYSGIVFLQIMGIGTMQEAKNTLEEALGTPKQQARPDPSWVNLLASGSRLHLHRMEWEVSRQYLDEAESFEGMLEWHSPWLLFNRTYHCITQEKFALLADVVTQIKDQESSDLEVVKQIARGYIYGIQGNYVVAEVCFSGAASLAVQDGNLPLSVGRGSYLGLLFVFLLAARLDKARSLINLVNQIEPWTSGPHFHYLWNNYQAVMKMIKGNLMEAELDILSSKQFFIQVGDELFINLTNRFLALQHLLAGRPGAEEEVAETERVLEEKGFPVRGIYTREIICSLYQQGRSGTKVMGGTPRLPLDSQLAWQVRHLSLSGHTKETLVRSLVNLIQLEAPKNYVMVTDNLMNSHEEETLYREGFQLFHLQITPLDKKLIWVKEPIGPTQISRIQTLVDLVSKTPVIPMFPVGADYTLRIPPEANELLGNCPSIREIRTKLPLLAKGYFPIVLEGPSGSGKSFLARLLHRLSPRSGEDILFFDTKNVPPGELGGQLFGYPNSTQGGVLEAARGGVLVIKGMETIPLSLQERLARTLSIESLEGEKPMPRLFLSTQEDLESLRDRLLLSPVLFDYLQGVRVKLPPLKDREGDLFLFLQFFLAESFANLPHLPGFTEDALAYCLQFQWPGNLKELHKTCQFLARYQANQEVIGRDRLIQAILSGDAEV